MLSWAVAVVAEMGAGDVAGAAESISAAVALQHLDTTASAFSYIAAATIAQPTTACVVATASSGANAGPFAV